MIEDAYRKCLLCGADMPAWSEKSVCHKHSSGNLDHRLDETTPAAGGSVAGRGDEARGHQSATTDPAQLIDKARLIRGNLEKAREVLADYDAGRPLQVRGDGWLVRLAAEIERLRAALEEIRDHWACQYDHPRKQNEMYSGAYGIGITDGHRAAAIIAHAALPVVDSSTVEENPGKTGIR